MSIICKLFGHKFVLSRVYRDDRGDLWRERTPSDWCPRCGELRTPKDKELATSTNSDYAAALRVVDAWKETTDTPCTIFFFRAYLEQRLNAGTNVA